MRKKPSRKYHDKSYNNNGSDQTNSNSNSKVFNKNNAKKQLFKKTEDPDLSTHPVRPVVKLTTLKRIGNLEQMQRTDRLLGIDDRKDKTKFNRGMLKATQVGMFKLQPKI